MTAREFLATIAQQGIQVWTEGEKLRFRAPIGVLTPDQRSTLRRHKTEIIDLLSRHKTLPLSFPQQRLCAKAPKLMCSFRTVIYLTVSLSMCCTKID